MQPRTTGNNYHNTQKSQKLIKENNKLTPLVIMHNCIKPL